MFYLTLGYKFAAAMVECGGNGWFNDSDVGPFLWIRRIFLAMALMAYCRIFFLI